MRSRTELVTTKLEGSDFEEETDFEDSEEDWQPAKDDPKNKPKVKSPSRPRKSTAGNKNGAKKRGRKSVKKPKKKTSEEDDGDEEEVAEEEEEEEVAVPSKKAKKSTTESVLQDEGKSPASSSTGKQEATTSAVPSSKPQPLQRKIANPLKSFPDKCGFLNLYIFRGDLKDGIINNTQVCLWRRDGSSLLQKYLRDTTVTTENPQYSSSMVYSCWEDKRADEYLEVKVKCLDQAKQVRVELIGASELEAKAASEYEKYVDVHGVPPPRNNARKTGNDASAGTEDEDDEDGDDDYDDVEDDEEDEAVKEEE
ncbi:glutamic acid-rich protein [Wyeomyia smithii]|uniref:glutamic acid-rich protein n=1 Tax=Wyeomyia smithii TaxID=174621 RepID=UPI002467E682|nr:glutamic acid-rich protein [Wyeomyia smithii]XP_055546860.1 glutamic acid-rich protein [Wyeomyia smithii]